MCVFIPALYLFCGLQSNNGPSFAFIGRLGARFYFAILANDFILQA